LRESLRIDMVLLAEGMVASAEYNIKFLEDLDFTDIKVSLKASDVDRTVDAYRMLRERNSYPFHLGVTEAGTLFHATIKIINLRFRAPLSSLKNGNLGGLPIGRGSS